MNKFAKILSYIFDGTLISIPMLIIICLAIVSNTAKALGWAFLCLTFAMIIPYLYIHILFRKKVIDDLHISNKGDRIKPLIITIISNDRFLYFIYSESSFIFRSYASDSHNFDCYSWYYNLFLEGKHAHCLDNFYGYNF